MNCESPAERLVVLRFIINLFDLIVAGDDDAFWTEVDRTSFGLSGEWVVVGPHLEMMATYHFGTKLLDDDSLLAVIAIPPLRAGLQEGVRPLGADREALTGTGRTPVPLGLECGDSLVVILNYHVEIHGLLNLLEFLQRDQAFVDSSDRPILNEHFVAGLRVAGYGL